jgi:pSer/pThr/pTyr-binding forkhead associated (FHA) protein
MSPYKDAALKIEKLIRASRLNDLDSLMKYGQAERLNELAEAVSKLDPGGYLIGCGPYTQGIFRLSGEETIFGRQATIHENPVDAALDFSLNDAVTFRPREISRRHFKITHQISGTENIFYITDVGSTCGTYLNGTLLEPQQEEKMGTDTRVAKPLADLDVISLGTGLVNLFVFLQIPSASSNA